MSVLGCSGSNAVLTEGIWKKHVKIISILGCPESDDVSSKTRANVKIMWISVCSESNVVLTEKDIKTC